MRYKLTLWDNHSNIGFFADPPEHWVIEADEPIKAIEKIMGDEKYYFENREIIDWGMVYQSYPIPFDNWQYARFKIEKI